MLPDFKTYFKVIGIEVVWYWHKDRQIYQWNKLENTEIDLYICGKCSIKVQEIMIEKLDICLKNFLIKKILKIL